MSGTEKRYGRCLKYVFFIHIFLTSGLIIHITVKYGDTTRAWIPYTRQDEVKDDRNVMKIISETNEDKACTDSFKETHVMTIQKPFGRIGNNMFQILSLLGSARHYCYTPVLKKNYGKGINDIFHFDFIKRIPNKQAKKWKKFKPPFYSKYDVGIEALNVTYNWTLSGYLQSYRYFYRNEKYLKSVLKFKEHILQAATGFLETIPQTKNVVCVHVRRGDMVNLYELGYAVASADYLRRAMNHFISNISMELSSDTWTRSDVTFIYLSDDIRWCRDNFNDSNIFFSPFSSDARKDLALMKLCNHSIITSGTFGWMGAWLSGGHVVYFKGFPRPGSILDQNMTREDYYPPEWIGMI